MTPEQLLAVGTAFATYLRLFQGCFVQARTGEHFVAYCRGLLSDLPRKSIEPLALACGTAVRTLQEFLRDHVWTHFRMRDQLQERLAQAPLPEAAAELGSIGVIDETSNAKKGTKTPGVHRQYCGSLGKVENCIVTVHLGIVRGRFKTLIDADLFLPQVWSEDRERCREAAIPDDVVYRPKWRIALEQLDRAAANGVALNWLTFDEYYGSKPAFLEDLDARAGMYYVGEIPRNFRCLAKRPRGSKPSKGWKGKRVDNLARFSSAWNQRQWHGVSLARLTLDNQEWEVRAGQVYLVRRGELSQRTYWLIVARNVTTGEMKYFISNAPADTPVETLLRVAFTRWNVEHAFRLVKSEIGFGHFEGRSYVGLMRHMILCLVVMGFVAEHTDRLRGGKSGDHAGAGLPGVEPALPDLAGQSRAGNASRAYDGGHCLSPAA
jgi:SRSO17 transposase